MDAVNASHRASRLARLRVRWQIRFAYITNNIVEKQ